MKPVYVLLLITTLLFVTNCDCDPSKQAQFPGSWVACMNNTPVQMGYVNNDAVILSDSKGGNFDPSQWSCPDTSSSPIWKGSGSPALKSSTVLGPVSGVRRLVNGAAGTNPTVAYLPRLLLNLPFAARPSPSDIANLPCDPSQPDVLQVNHDYASVNRISTCPFKAVATIPVAGHPLQIAVTPDGSTAVVTSYDNAISFINLATNQVSSTLSTPTMNPNGIAITPDGANFYVTSFVATGATVAKYSLSTHNFVASIAVPGYPQSLTLSPDGSQLFVTFPYLNIVQIYDTMTNTLSSTLSIPVPRDVAFNSHGTKAYISGSTNTADSPDYSTFPGVVKVLDKATFQFTNTYNVGIGPSDINVPYGDAYVIVNNYEGMSVSLIDVIAGTVSTTPVNGQPSGIFMVR